MVRYVARARTTMTTMSTNQVGLKMSGCPSRVGRKGATIRSFNKRVNCMQGLCGGARMNGQIWKTTERNRPPFCIKPATKCAQAAGGVGRINAPYFNRKIRAGESGCTPASLVTTTTTTLNVTMAQEAEGLAAVGYATSFTPNLVNGIALNSLTVQYVEGAWRFWLGFNPPTAPRFTDVKFEYQDGTSETFYFENIVPGGPAHRHLWNSTASWPTFAGNATLTFTY